ncbi:MAG: spore cortex-lytic enzyme [Bacillota bacterium]|nr:spore cortex-lytic enzyme [Bacillota bacterium]
MKRYFKHKLVLILTLALIFSYTSANIIFPFLNSVGAATYAWGSRGTVVTEIQRKLKAWGYYKSSVDGIYGYNTYRAVRYFQSKNGLKVDGAAGDQTLAAMGINPKSSSQSSGNQNVVLLSRLINGEARGEPYEGQVAVGAVILNRVKDPRFPNTIAGVIYQPGAFTAVVDGQINAVIAQSSINAARDALNGWDPSGGAVYYFNPATATSKWIWSRPLIKVIGDHRFCN